MKKSKPFCTLVIARLSSSNLRKESTGRNFVSHHKTMAIERSELHWADLFSKASRKS